MTDGGADTFTRDLFAWQAQVLADRGMTLLALHVALVIGQHWNRDSGEAWPSQELIASKLSVTDRAVRKAVDQLASRGHLFVVTPSGRKGGNRYRPIVRLSEPVHRNSRSGYEVDDRNACSYETADHRNDGSGKDPLHRNACSDEKGVHRNDGSGLTGTGVPPNHLNEPSEDIDCVPASPKPKARPRAAKSATSDADFDKAYGLYPRHVAPDAAKRAYAAAISKGATPADILAGVQRYATERTGEPERWTAHMASWLNAGRWRDAPARPSAQHQPNRSNGQRFSAIEYFQETEGD